MIIQLLLSFIFLVPMSSTRAQFATPEPQLSEDTCYNEKDFENSDSYCLYTGLLADGRDELYSSKRQCRILCEKDASELHVTRKATECALCRNETAILDYRIFRNGLGTHEDICIPRSVCIERCGPEGEGCIYSGTCETLFCFTGKPWNKTAHFVRTTHAGPGSILTVETSELNSTGQNLTFGRWDNLPDPNVIEYGSDLCAHHGTFDTGTRNCPLYPDGPIADGRREWEISSSVWEEGQCRAYCEHFDRDKYEVERLQTRCGFCNTDAAASYFNMTEDLEDMVCIPREKCIEQCGAERPGCWYTGSCESQICVWSITSKRPVQFSHMSDTGHGVTISVNHSRPAIGIEPPIFSHSNAPSPVNDVNATKSPRISPSPTPTTSTEGTPFPTTPLPKRDGGDDDEEGDFDELQTPEFSPPPSAIEPSPEPCIATHHLHHLSTSLLVFKNHRRASVLCDASRSCATSTHMVVWHGQAMTMAMYCHLADGGTGCSRRVTWVNSPKYAPSLRLPSQTKGLTFTPFSAKYGSVFERRVLQLVIHAGF